MKYCTYKRLKTLFYFERETKFDMVHRLNEKYLLHADLLPYETPKKLYDKSVDIFKWVENEVNPKLSGNRCVFSTKDFDLLKSWLKDNKFL